MDDKPHMQGGHHSATPVDAATKACCHDHEPVVDHANPAQKTDAAVIFTCPMHPEIRQGGPGPCPICGMALEAETVTLEGADNSELKDITRRFWISAGLSLPLLVMVMGGHALGLSHLVPDRISIFIQMALASPVVLWGGCFVLCAGVAVD